MKGGTLVAWTPYIDFAFCNLQSGEFLAAGEFLQTAITHRAERMPDTLQQDQAEFDRTVATFLLAVGHGPEAERFARRSAESPGRSGSKLIPAASRQLVALMTQWTVLEAKLAQLEETDFLTTTSILAGNRRASVRAESWTLESQIRQFIADPERSNPLRPYLPGEARCDAWLLGEYLRILPSGVATELLRQARGGQRSQASLRGRLLRCFGR